MFNTLVTDLRLHRKMCISSHAQGCMCIIMCHITLVDFDCGCAGVSQRNTFCCRKLADRKSDNFQYKIYIGPHQCIEMHLGMHPCAANVVIEVTVLAHVHFPVRIGCLWFLPTVWVPWCRLRSGLLWNRMIRPAAIEWGRYKRFFQKAGLPHNTSADPSLDGDVRGHGLD